MFPTEVCGDPSELRMVCQRFVEAPRLAMPTTNSQPAKPAQLTAVNAPAAAGVLILVQSDQLPEMLRRRCHSPPPITATRCSARSTPAQPIAVSVPSPGGILSWVKLVRQPEAVRMVWCSTPSSTPSTCRLAPIAAQATASKVRSAPASGMLANAVCHCPEALRRMCHRLVSPPPLPNPTRCSAAPDPAALTAENGPADPGLGTAVDAVQLGFGIRVVCRTSFACAPTTCRLLSRCDLTVPVIAHMLASMPTSPYPIRKKPSRPQPVPQEFFAIQARSS